MAIQILGDGNPDGTGLVSGVTELVNIYGGTPVAQRASSLQATSQISLTTFMTINTNVAALFLEIAQTLQAIGIWKGSA